MIGTRIGSYRLTRKLGEGGMGVVFLAEHETISGARMRKAVKVLHDHFARDPEIMGRFKAEAEAVANLDHDNIIGIDEFGQLTDPSTGTQHWFIMMPFLEGVPLSTFLADRGPLSVHMTLHIVAQVGAALNTAHAAGFVHRDLKPENVFISHRASNAHFVRLLDFGIVKNTRAAEGMRTQSGVVLGTPVFMAAEQFGDAAQADARSDVFSLGVMTYNMLSGRFPWGSPKESWMDLYFRQRNDPPAQLPDGVPPGWVETIVRALAYEPSARPQSVREFVVALAVATPDDPLEPSGMQTLRDVAPELLLTGHDAATTKNPSNADLARALLPRIGSTPVPEAPAVSQAATTRTAHPAGNPVPVARRTEVEPASAGYFAPNSVQTPMTTISSASGAIAPGAPAQMVRRRSAVPIAIGAVVVVGIATVVTLKTFHRGSAPTAAASGDRTASAADAAPVAAANQTAQPPPPPTPAPSPVGSGSTGSATAAGSATRSIRISTDPPGATLIVDGETLGPAPRDLGLQTHARAVVRARMPGYHEATETLTFDMPGDEVVLRLRRKGGTTATAEPASTSPPTKPDAAPAKSGTKTFNPDDVIGN